MPCVPYAGDKVGFFAIPPIGANLWVEFEGGDPDYPIWSGCYWGSGQVPASAGQPTIKVLKTDDSTITLNDQPGAGEICISSNSGMKIVINSNGIEINNGAGGSITLSSNKVTVNEGALEVM
jgi:uncharacterized protein involved in type VI secretion and phage assembly